jgi:putative membrane protein
VASQSNRVQPRPLRATNETAMTSDAQAILQSWSAPLGVNLALSLAALVYLRGWFRLHAALPTLFSAWRLTTFVAGVISVWVAIGSPVAAFDDISLSVHMLQHLLLMSAAPPLILLGSPALPLLQGLPESLARKVLAPVLRLAPVKRFGHFVTNPAVCWLAAALALIGWHVPAVFELALRHEWLHHLEHASFLVTGLLFWWPVVQPWPSTARWPEWLIPLYLFCATLPCDALSGFLAFCDRVIYSSYLFAPHLFGLPPLEDQELAAAFMWASVTFILLVPAVVITMHILSPQRGHPSGEDFSRSHRVIVQPLEAAKPEVA